MDGRMWYAVGAVVLVGGALLFSFFMPVIQVSNSDYAPPTSGCPSWSCPANYVTGGPFSIFASPTFVYLHYRAVVYDGRYSISYVEAPPKLPVGP